MVQEGCVSVQHLDIADPLRQDNTNEAYKHNLLYLVSQLVLDAIYAKIDPSLPNALSEQTELIRKVFGVETSDNDSQFGICLPREVFTLGWPLSLVIQTNRLERVKRD